MNGKAPLTVFPWEENLMDRLLEQAIKDTRGDVGSAVFIFPHSRPERYLLRSLRHDARVRRPMIAPRCLTVSDLFREFRSRIWDVACIQAGMLDRVGLLLQCARQELDLQAAANARTARSTKKSASLPLEAERFFPWGLHLASLFEECLIQRCKPGNFLNTGGQVSPFAELLLSRLAHIFERYTRALAEREWSTPGFDASLASDWLEKHGKLPSGLFRGEAIFIAGFHSLTGSENVLFRHLWERHNARIILHADPALANPSESETAHWSCRALADWAKRWGTILAPASPPDSKIKRKDQSLRYYEAFDLHSQLRVLERELADLAGSETETHSHPPPGETPARENVIDTVVVLTDNSLLMPALHHLPRTNINISMGYPLARSPLFRLLDTLLRLQEGRRGDGYYWRDLTELLRHPYIKMLRSREASQEETDASPAGKRCPPPAAQAKTGEEKTFAERNDGYKETSLRRELYRLEQSLRALGRKYASCRALLEHTYGGLIPEDTPPPHLITLLDDIITACLENFTNPRNLHDLGLTLKSLCALLLTHGEGLWQHFPIDAECLYRLMHSLIPELVHSRLAKEPFPPSTLFAMLRRLMEAERVPFEAEPLVGLQIMGMLETRMLSFRRVVVLDAVEDALPGATRADPLLPESLRRELGLPPLHTREQVAAYHFFRLAKGAQELVLLWQESDFDLAEGKKKKSRFVEELLWREEKRLGRLLQPEEIAQDATAGQGRAAYTESMIAKRDGPLTVLGSVFTPLSKQARGIAVSPAIRALIRSLLEQPLSVSLLDAYLRCPVQFFHQRLIRLNPTEEIQEGEDPAGVGELFHEVLREGYNRRGTGMLLPGGEELAASLGPELIDILYNSPRFSALARSLPADAFIMLGCAGETRLRRYLELQGPSTVLALEYPLSASFSRNGLLCTLTGKADRIDMRAFPADEPGHAAQGIVILDYKTGRLPDHSPSFWEDRDLWRRLRGEEYGEHGASDSGPLLREISRRLVNMQLPLYLFLYSLCSEISLPKGAMTAEGKKIPVHDAAWVALGESGEEKTLFPPHFSRSLRTEIVEKHVPDLLYFLLRHMLESQEMLPHPGPYCGWCSCAKLCNITA
ncbi:MAG: PD-(D/E)XK nuclease family protein [Desulfovibrio sp.]|jgi:hypothetical protein|nr:PD-(D/E)XK nuclease family protein [Desulfovibrio sp.]